MLIQSQWQWFTCLWKRIKMNWALSILIYSAFRFAWTLSEHVDLQSIAEYCKRSSYSVFWFPSLLITWPLGQRTCRSTWLLMVSVNKWFTWQFKEHVDQLVVEYPNALIDWAQCSLVGDLLGGCYDGTPEHVDLLDRDTERVVLLSTLIYLSVHLNIPPSLVCWACWFSWLLTCWAR